MSAGFVLGMTSGGAPAMAATSDDTRSA